MPTKLKSRYVYKILLENQIQVGYFILLNIKYIDTFK